MEVYSKMKIVTDFNKRFPEYVLKVLSTFADNNISAYVVGGAVRDIVLGLEPHDYDITTEAPPEVVMSLFSEKGYTTYATDKEVSFGRCSVIIDGEEVEITTLRTDGKYSDSRHPDECGFISDIEIDANRRDFTMNALYLDLEGNLYDFHNGFLDIENKQVRFVGNPIDRIDEDPIRLLRFIRFTLKTSDTIDMSSCSFVLTHVHKLLNVAPERIKAEIEKIFLCGSIYGFEFLLHSGVLRILFGQTVIEDIILCKQISKYHPEGNLVQHITEVYRKAVEAE